MLMLMLLALAGAPGQSPASAAAPAAQNPPAAQTPAGSQTPAAAQAPAAELEPAATYSYDPEGRRDPFVSLVGRGTDPKRTGERAPGLPGLLVNEVTVKGTMRGRSGYIAMIQASDNKTYIVRAGDRLMDGTVKTVTEDGVVFSQDVNDPLSLVKQREVAKRVRAGEGRG
jgi:Tfp pilus assembly protein PilP